MDRELQNNKRLREMFRLFQRTKKHCKKMNEQEEDEEQPIVTLPIGRRSPSALRRSTMKSGLNRRKRSSSRKKLVTQEENVEDDEEAQPTPEPSTSEKRRQLIRKKYGIRSKDEQVSCGEVQFFQRASRDDVEEFENVDATFRPAATKMRKAKLRWKCIENEHESAVRRMNKGERELAMDGACKFESSSAPNMLVKSEEPLAVDQSDHLDYTQSFEDIGSSSPERAVKQTKTKDKSEEKIDQLLREITKLLLRISDLEQTQQKAAVTIKKLRTDLAVREKKISELNKKIALLERKEIEAHTMEKVAEKTSDEDDKLTPQQEAITLRGLGIMKRNQILEQILKPSEANTLADFFQADMAKPNKMIVKLIDKAFAYGIEVLLMRPDLFEDVVDNELRLLLLDSAKAKRIFLDCMLLHPEYVPISWGGDVLAKRQQQQQAFAEKYATKATQNGKAAEKSQGNTISQNPRTLVDLFDTKPSLHKGFQEASPTNRSFSPAMPLKVEERRDRKPDIEVKTEVPSEDERKTLQREVNQEKMIGRRAENIVQDDAEERPKPGYAESQFPARKMMAQNDFWALDRGTRVLRNRRSKFRPPKRKGRREKE